MKAPAKIPDDLNWQGVHFSDTNRAVTASTGFTCDPQFGRWGRRIYSGLHRMVTVAARAGWGMQHPARHSRAMHASSKGNFSFDVTGPATLRDLLSANRQGQVRAVTCGA